MQRLSYTAPVTHHLYIHCGDVGKSVERRLHVSPFQGPPGGPGK